MYKDFFSLPDWFMQKYEACRGCDMDLRWMLKMYHLWNKIS